MALNRKILAAGLAALALLGTSVAASASPAVVTGNINVRSGPGTYYRAIDTIRRGERVDVQYCEGSWCFVEKRGPDGWVSASYLERGRPGRPDWDRPGRPDWDRPGRPDWDRPGRPGWNGPGRPGWDRPGRSDGSVCFNGPDGYICLGN
ncbi:SH3 domain-containing protein [uncultured Devosia sp.]|uniref:SH3 domain-containing protein n=1 Tax=uncultured Devosia sp. TaxID=211434 RepID=UPI0035CC88C5